jgi:diaminopimelate epimerase
MTSSPPTSECTQGCPSSSDERGVGAKSTVASTATDTRGDDAAVSASEAVDSEAVDSEASASEAVDSKASASEVSTQPDTLPHTLSYTKGDGTGNDFIIICDLDDTLTLEAQEIAQWCNRSSGVGADGLLRVVRKFAADGRPRFFMDYRNADGTLAETCGNGLRVFTTYLLSRAFIKCGRHVMLTRGGPVTVVASSDADISVDMGAAVDVRVDDFSVIAAAAGAPSTYPAKAVLMPNPHAVAILDDIAETPDLATSPSHTPAEVFPDGANYEFIELHPDQRISMRVFERGVGETQSCGSGACAAAAVAAQQWGLASPWEIRVDVPGGELLVRCDESGNLHLQGPAQLTHEGHLSRSHREVESKANTPQSAHACRDALSAKQDDADFDSDGGGDATSGADWGAREDDTSHADADSHADGFVRGDGTVNADAAGQVSAVPARLNLAEDA